MNFNIYIKKEDKLVIARSVDISRDIAVAICKATWLIHLIGNGLSARWNIRGCVTKDDKEILEKTFDVDPVNKTVDYSDDLIKRYETIWGKNDGSFGIWESAEDAIYRDYNGDISLLISVEAGKIKYAFVDYGYNAEYPDYPAFTAQKIASLFTHDSEYSLEPRIKKYCEDFDYEIDFFDVKLMGAEDIQRFIKTAEKCIITED